MVGYRGRVGGGDFASDFGEGVGYSRLLSRLDSRLKGRVLGMSAPQSGYAPVNGLQMYYEIHSAGEPLVLARVKCCWRS